MLYIFLFVALLSSVSCQTLRGSDDEWIAFNDFKEKFAKKYENFEEMKNRFAVFRDNLRFIREHNSLTNQTFTLGVNQFTDMTNEEFKSYVNKYQQPTVGSFGCQPFSSNAANAPASVDWVAKGAVTSVKDQGQCGSCWTFSSTGCMEGAWAISKGQLIDLSEEELVDCVPPRDGGMACNGGQMDSAFKYIIQNGQCKNSEYPYTAGVTQTAGTCQKCTPVVHATSCYDVTPNDQVALKAAVAKQPVSTAVQADQPIFQHYSSGVLTSTTCTQNLDHGILIVGYGEENGQKYWNVKNSWSSSWGNQGYIKIARSDSTNDAGICGIGMMNSFITV